MKKIKAVFFDRDNTITYFNPEKKEFLSNFIYERTGNEYKLSYDEMMNLFDLAGYPKEGLKSIDEEVCFWKRYYIQLLNFYGSQINCESDAEVLFNELWCNNDKLLFPEVVRVFKFFKNEGIKIGIISDTSPSLQRSLEQLNLGQFIDSYTCSDLVGAMKPDPIIFEAALSTLGVMADECIYVDDYDVESDGAREIGFTSFNIVRKSNIEKDKWQINSLDEIVTYYKNRSYE